MGFIQSVSVAKKMIDRKQLKGLLHVDDLKVSHLKLSKLKGFAEQLNPKFGKEMLISKLYGKQHDYLE